jgi:hypothetical protein
MVSQQMNLLNKLLKIPASFPEWAEVGRQPQGMSISGKNSVVQYNEIDSSGYIGIAFSGNALQIDKNFINYFCLIKDDGGGIYTQGNNRNIISNNVI